MFSFGSEVASAGPNFVPEASDRRWLADVMASLVARLGPPASAPRVLVEPPGGVPRGFDALFDMICGVQELVGQGSLELTLVEVGPEGAPNIPPGFSALGDPTGQMLHTLHRPDAATFLGPQRDLALAPATGGADRSASAPAGTANEVALSPSPKPSSANGEYAVLYNPMAFRKPELLLASVAREVGRIAIHHNGGHDPELDVADHEAEAELAGITLGLGVWVTNGAYVFENACCGGGCGIDLRSLRTGLSMPEAAYATAYDALRRGLGRRSVAKALAPTQKAAFKKNWAVAQKQDQAALGAPARRGILSAARG